MSDKVNDKVVRRGQPEKLARLKQAGGLLCLLALPLAAAEVDPSQLPPAAQGKVDFDRDIKPIFEKSCLRCHGPERPKSRFRLDNGDSALKGGDRGVDIIPGDSAKSPLIHYVSRVVEDMEMPPAGKGDALTPAQIGWLRAWIDQGASWGALTPAAPLALDVVPVAGGFFVQGDKAKFREVEGAKDGFSAGVERFSVTEWIGPDKKFSLEGRALFPENDIQLKLGLTKTDVGFVRGGFEQWRRYYDDYGGYYSPFAVPTYSLGKDLYLDVGRAWIDWGLTLPRLPQLVLGYEYQYKQGSKSMLEWGSVGGPVDVKNIYPALMEVEEHTHIVKLDITYEAFQWRLEDNARLEFYDAQNTHVDSATFGSGPTPDSTVRTDDGSSQTQGMNTLRVERQFWDCWLVSGGYYYSKLNGSASLNQETVNSVGAPVTGTFWSASDIVLKRESQILSFGNLLQPTAWLDATLAVQSEWTRQSGAGNVNLDSGDPNLPGAFFQYPSVVSSDLDEQKLSEEASLRFTAIPWTVLFAEGRFSQDSIGQFEQDAPSPGTPPDPSVTFLRNTDYTNDRMDLRGGFDTSPWRWLAVSASYRRLTSDSDYANSKTPANSGYSAFIRERTIAGNETQAKLVLRPRTWLQATLTYQWAQMDYHTTTDAVPGGNAPAGLLAATSDGQTFGLGLILTPIQRLYFSGAFTYTRSRIATAVNSDPSIVPYQGDIYGLTLSANYTLNPQTDLRLTYAFSQANYGQNNIADGLPLGVDYTRNGVMLALTRRFTSRLTASLRYGFFQYSEPTSGGVTDYTAHGVFLALAMKWP